MPRNANLFTIGNQMVVLPGGMLRDVFRLSRGAGLQPSLMGGYLHVAPGADPLAGFRGRPAMVPLTYAWIEHWSGDVRSVQSTGTIVVNRDRADWMRLVTDEDLISGQLRPVRPSRPG